MAGGYISISGGSSRKQHRMLQFVGGFFIVVGVFVVVVLLF